MLDFTRSSLLGPLVELASDLDQVFCPLNTFYLKM